MRQPCQGAVLQRFAHGLDGAWRLDGLDGAGALLFLHDAMAPPLADGNKSMIAQQIADALAGEDFTLGHIPPRTG